MAEPDKRTVPFLETPQLIMSTTKEKLKTGKLRERKVGKRRAAGSWLWRETESQSDTRRKGCHEGCWVKHVEIRAV